MTRNFLFSLTCAALLLAGPIDAADLPTLSPSDYDQFENLDRSPALSPDGLWVTYSVTRVDRDRTLHVREVTSEEGLTFPWGESPEFADDSRHLGWIIGLSDEEKKELEKEDKTPRHQVAILPLGDEAPTTYADKLSFAFDATGRFVAILGYAPEEPKGKGADLRVLDLDSGTEVTLGNVAEYLWSDTDSLLALAIATGKDDGNGVQVFDAADGRLRGLDTSSARYHSLSWREDALVFDADGASAGGGNGGGVLGAGHPVVLHLKALLPHTGVAMSCLGKDAMYLELIAAWQRCGALERAQIRCLAAFPSPFA